MKKLIIKYWLICAFLFQGFISNAVVLSPFIYADSLFNASDYKFAAIEYERIYYSSSDNLIKADALLKKSYCLKLLKDFSESLKTLQRISFDNLSDSLIYKIKFEQAFNYFLDGNYKDAEVNLNQIHYFTDDSLMINDILYLEIITKNELLKWDESDSLFIIYLKNNKVGIDSSYFRVLLKKPKLLKPQTAKILSLIIPGSGQIYAGQIFRGLTSIALQACFMYYTVKSIEDKFYLSALTTGIPIFEKFYLGGAKYSYYLAEKQNAKKIAGYNKKIRDFILSIEKYKS